MEDYFMYYTTLEEVFFHLCSKKKAVVFSVC